MGRFLRIMAAYETKSMPVNHEVKGHLARLLATEDLVVEHKNVPTASFNVDTRVLILPMWEKASNAVYDMLVGHEVGHALYTPNEDWSVKFSIPQQFVNVTEDARIEKLMKRRYGGMNKCFYAGYRELHDDDFFQVKDEDLSTFNLADRVNLYFKIGNYLELQFNPEELEIVEMIGDAETFDEAIEAAVKLYEYCKKEQKQETKISSLDNVEHNFGGGSEPTPEYQNQSAEDELETSGDGGQASSEGQSEDKMDQPTMEQTNQGGETSEPEVRTADSLEEAIRDLVNTSSYENVYVELPKLNLNTVIALNSEIHAEINNWWNKSVEKFGETCSNPRDVLFKSVDKEYLEFKRSAQKEVNYLVKEFECKKAADSYARSTTARTGVLDCSKLHTYKYNEDLFRKVTTLADGKNHGLVFILDWSGSMSNVMQDTIKQLYNLIWFCKKVTIPFEVYAFTNEWRRNSYDEDGNFIKMEPHYQKKHGLIHVDESFSLMNLFTSKVNNRVLEEQMINIYRIAKEFKYSYNNAPMYTTPARLCLSGTPLNESLIALHQILPKFQKENKLQKVQCVVLTDGEACYLKFHKEFTGRSKNNPEEVYIGLNSLQSYPSFIRDRKVGRTYKVREEYHQLTDTLLENLRDSFPSVNFIGMRVLENREANSFIRKYYNNYDYSSGYCQDNKEYIQVINDWKKNRSFSIKNSGYHSYFGLSGSALSQESEFDVAEDASKSQIKSAFVKSLKSKKMNKKILGEFIDLVA
jgi:hypothetical protein